MIPLTVLTELAPWEWELLDPDRTLTREEEFERKRMTSIHLMEFHSISCICNLCLTLDRWHAVDWPRTFGPGRKIDEESNSA